MDLDLSAKADLVPLSGQSLDTADQCFILVSTNNWPLTTKQTTYKMKRKQIAKIYNMKTNLGVIVIDLGLVGD